MSCVRGLEPWSTDLIITWADEAFLWDALWLPSTGVDQVDFTADLRNLALGSGAAVAIKPAVQLAAVRVDRPDGGAAISAGSVLTGSGLTHFRETLSGASKFFFRRGWSARLTSGSYARVELTQYAAFRACGGVLPPRDFAIDPVNAGTDVRYVSLSDALPTIGISKAKLAVLGMGNANADLEYRVAGRAFNDPLARGEWVDLQAGWTTPSAGNFEANTGEVDLAALSPSASQWLELGFAVRKGAGGDPNSRASFRVLPATVGP
jgi:hypothetical protein